MVAVSNEDVIVPGATVPGVAATDLSTTGAPRVDAVRIRRAVAVVVDAMELLRPRSDLARLLETFDRVDLLVATEYPDQDESTMSDVDDDGGDEQDEQPEHDEVASGVEGLGLDDITLHRLGLRIPLAAGAEDDLIAALSELVGFDPEPGVYCLAPALPASDQARTVINRAAQRIAQVYGLPLLRYRCLELSVVGADSP